MSSALDCDGGDIVQADPDVAGIGVILSFLITAWSSHLAAILAFVFCDNAVLEDIASPLDMLVVQAIRWPFKKDQNGQLLWRPNQDLMEQICMMMADQQLITGASILIVCFSTHETITQYHFAIGASLSYASFAVFQDNAIVASRSLRENTLKKSWRFVWSVLMTVAATLANFVISEDDFFRRGHWGASVQCVWNKMGSRTASYSADAIAVLSIWTIVALDGSASMARFIWPEAAFRPIYDAVVAFLPSTFVFAISFVDETLLRHTHSQVRKFLGYILLIPFVATFWATFVVFEIWASVNFSLFRSFLILFTATKAVASFREEARKYYLEGDEDKWGFGQILPMLLLVLPLFQWIEMVYGSWRKRKIGADSRNQAIETQAISKNEAVPDVAVADLAPSPAPGLLSRRPTQLRSLTVFNAIHTNSRVNTAGASQFRSKRRGFMRILELHDLDMETIEEVLYYNNPGFKASMILALLAGYIGVLTISFEFNFTL